MLETEEFVFLSDHLAQAWIHLQRLGHDRHPNEVAHVLGIAVGLVLDPGKSPPGRPLADLLLVSDEEGTNHGAAGVRDQLRFSVEGGEDPRLDRVPQVVSRHNRASQRIEEGVPFVPPKFLGGKVAGFLGIDPPDPERHLTFFCETLNELLCTLGVDRSVVEEGEGHVTFPVHEKIGDHHGVDAT